jgi:S1-C subfamily serine protease/beta-xylosidase
LVDIFKTVNYSFTLAHYHRLAWRLSLKKSVIMALVAFVCLSQTVFADLTDYIVVVKPIFHKTTQATFLKLAQRFEKDGHSDLASYFSNLAGEHGHGTGWIYVDHDGENYIITNRHVVSQAEKVNVYFMNPDGSQVSYNDCPILYVDDQFDLAICQFPKKSRKYPKALEANTAVQKDLADVVAAGYPGFGKEPVWQIAKGNVSNSQARWNKNYDYLIQHTAPIDPGNSGGPLLMPDAKASLGYKVIGVNTWKAAGREATNFAIPVKDVLATLERAKDSQKLVLNMDEKRARLLRECKILASEASSHFPDYTRVYRFISYAMVGENGFDALSTVIDNVDNKKEWTAMFLDDPVEAMRMALFYLIWFDLKDKLKDDITLEFKEINFADSEDLAAKNEIRTKFTIKDKAKEIVWVVEQGHWRVKSFVLPDIVPNTSTAADTGKTQVVKANEPLEKGEFRDDFNSGKLSAGWQSLREDPARWSLQGKMGALGITLQKGDLYKTTNDAKNILLRQAEVKDYTVHTKLEFGSNFNFHQAGLIVYADDDNYLVVYYGSHPEDGGHTAGNAAVILRFGIISESDGEVKRSTLSFFSSPMDLWIVKKGEKYAGYVGNEKKGFQKIGEFTNSLGGSPKVGLFAYCGIDPNSKTYPRTLAQFDEFSITLKEPKGIIALEEDLIAAEKGIPVIAKEREKTIGEQQLPAPRQGEYRDLFSNGTLDSGWKWLNENKTKWSLQERPGLLRIDNESGDLYKTTNNARNILLRDPALKDFTVEVKLEYTPTSNFQQAGILVYLDNDNYVMVYYGSHPVDGSGRTSYPTIKSGIVSESNGSVKVTAIAIFQKDIYLRIVKKGDKYTGLVGSEATGYQQIGEFSNKMGSSPRVGVFAYCGSDDSLTLAPRAPAYFDYFRIIPAEE